MKSPTVLEGTWEEINRDHAAELTGRHVRLIVIPDDKGSEQEDNFFRATPEERSAALDALAEMNRGLPILPPEAFDRENLYEERF
jgi:hypothetical protein